ncbi:spore protease YyaC [Paenibacillus protaetiae]|uniref:spore protease YyaC n=1 Tax=Paenibacillus protaetiae TaxID=2509456 RepID=UPI001FC91AE8|nr:spore protease YyaC [Paenibacillus protaetiae]
MKTDQNGLFAFLELIADGYPDRSAVAFLCIGTDRSTGDSYGPLVGMMLKERGWPNVVGTLEQPCDALSYETAVHSLANAGVIIAVDACLGKPGSTGKYICTPGALKPGEATKAGLPSAGHYSIAGIVGENGPKPYWVLQTASLYQVLQMAKLTADAIERAWGAQPFAAQRETKFQWL